MAQLRDVWPVLRRVGPYNFARRVVHEVLIDHITIWASALAYQWLFAVFPFFIFLLSLLPYLPQRAKVQVNEPLQQLVFVLPQGAAHTLWSNIQNVMEHQHRGLMSLGIIVALWAASGGMSLTLRAMDICFDLPHGRPLYRQRILAIILTVVSCVFILATLILLPIGTLAINWIAERHIAGISAGMLLLLNIARFAAAAILMFTFVAIVYYFGPWIKQEFHVLTPGAVFTVGVWLLLASFFRMYIEKFGRYDQTYGTVGGVAILLLFFYIDAMVLLIGAEINSEIDFARGIPRGTYDFRQGAIQLEQEPESSEDESEGGAEKAAK